MGRRKKEPESDHRDHIAAAAELLFVRKGIPAATMDNIAKEAGYSKATLYVYFTNKEEIVGYLVLKSMKKLYAYIAEALSGLETTKVKYKKLCNALALYQQQYPLYFTLTLSEINVDFSKEDSLPLEKDTFAVGEQINAEIIQFIQSGIEAGDFPPDIPILQTVFLFWASLSGVISMAANKQAYMEQEMEISREQFLDFGFEKLYYLIGWKE